MTREKAIQYAEKKIDSASYRLEMGYLNNGLRQIVSNEYEFFMQALSALRQQEHFRDVTKKVEPLTNAQKIRSMTDEELVNLHYSGSAHCIARDPTVCDRHDFIGNLTPCEQCYLKWLKQPCEGG